MALNTIGWLVTATIGGATVAGVVVGKPSTTLDRVGYQFRMIAGDRLVWAKEADTNSTATVSGSV